jgi:glycosyltransferase involved in cell wall biosynthesis
MISVVVPAYNESEGVPLLLERLTQCAEAWREPFELVFVDDGSVDDTWALLAAVAARDPRVKLVSFSRNFGHQAAVTAGLRASRGDLVAVIDADLQDPPEELRRFFAKCREGYDVVYAVRQKRKEHALKRASYFLYYRLLSWMSNISMPLDAGDFCVMSRRAVDVLNALPERNRFVRGLRSWIGFRQTGLVYQRDARAAGEAKYTFRRLVRLALDGIINFSDRPLRLITLTGLAVGALAAIAGVVFLVQYVTDATILGYNPRASRGWTSLMLAILFLGATQLVCIGLLGEYIIRLFAETKQRPSYVVRDTANLDNAAVARVSPWYDRPRERVGSWSADE